MLCINIILQVSVTMALGTTEALASCVGSSLTGGQYLNTNSQG